MFLEGLRIRAIEQGYRVFDVREKTDTLERELEAVATMEGQVLVVVEEYQNFLDAIQLFRSVATDRAVLVLTGRNAVHDVLIDDLTTVCGVPEVTEVNIDILNDDEVAWVVDMLDEYGLWGDRAGDSRQKKESFIQGRCRRQFHALLLSLLSSPDIQKRLTHLSDRLRDKGEHYEVLLSVFILTILNHGPTIDILTDIWGVRALGGSFRKDPVVKELVNFNYYAVLVRSPVAAEYLVKTTVDSATIIAVLIRMVKRIGEASSGSPRHQDIFRSLMRFSSIQLLLPLEGRGDAIIAYYESIKNLAKCKFNPLFWLQYAIAALVLNELGRAKAYFDTSYSLARKKGWDAFQIDNHFARFLLTQAIEELTPPDAVKNFQEAKAIINRQIVDERRHYPYRVAILYQGFLDRFDAELDASQIVEVSQAASKVLSRAEKLPGHRKAHRYVRDCVKSLNYVTTRCNEILHARAENTGTR